MKVTLLVNGKEVQQKDLKNYAIQNETVSQIVKNAASRYQKTLDVATRQSCPAD